MEVHVSFTLLCVNVHYGWANIKFILFNQDKYVVWFVSLVWNVNIRVPCWLFCQSMFRSISRFVIDIFFVKYICYLTVLKILFCFITLVCSIYHTNSFNYSLLNNIYSKNALTVSPQHVSMFFLLGGWR